MKFREKDLLWLSLSWEKERRHVVCRKLLGEYSNGNVIQDQEAAENGEIVPTVFGAYYIFRRPFLRSLSKCLAKRSAVGMILLAKWDRSDKIKGVILLGDSCRIMPPLLLLLPRP